MSPLSKYRLKAAALALCLLAFSPLRAEEGGPQDATQESVARAAEQEQAAKNVAEELKAKDKTAKDEAKKDVLAQRGGSFTLEPAYTLAAGILQDKLGAALGYNICFDIGVNEDISIIFGGGYNDLPGTQNPDFRFLLVPAWFGIKSKNQFSSTAEIYWSLAGSLYYEKTYMMNTGVGAQENLDGGAIFSAGYDVWWTRALLTGVEANFHFIFEQAQIYPFLQLAFRFGFRG